MSDSLIDFDHLATYTAGDERLEAEVLKMFSAQSDLWLKALHDSEDSEAWTAAAHSLKGSARGIGAWSLATLCEQAEALTENDTMEAHQAMYESIQRALLSVIQCIDDYLREKNAA